jgi:hypothetical protein
MTDRVAATFLGRAAGRKMSPVDSYRHHRGTPGQSGVWDQAPSSPSAGSAPLSMPSLVSR